MRVLQICHSFVVDEFRERSRLLHSQHGYDVHIACPSSWPEAETPVRAQPESAVPLHILGVHRPIHPTLFRYSRRSLRRLLADVQPDILDVQEEAYSLGAASVLHAMHKAKLDVPLCVYAAQNIERRHPLPLRQAERRMLRSAVAAFPCSNEAAAVLRSKGFRGAIHVIPLGVRMRTEPRPPREAVPVVGFVGGMQRHKGAHVLLDAFARLPAGSARLELVGGGPELGRLQRQAGDLGLDGRVTFVGPVTQAEALERIASFDVLAVPSLRTRRLMEQFGRVVAQAFAAGTPVLASSSGSLPGLIGDAGELFREGDANDLADHLRRLLDSPSRRDELAAAGCRRAEQQLTWPRVAERFDAMYREALAGA